VREALIKNDVSLRRKEGLQESQSDGFFKCWLEGGYSEDWKPATVFGRSFMTLTKEVSIHW
jgi:hypothetical protein